VKYTGEVNAFMPRATIPFLAVAATVAELLLGVALVAGFRLRWTALASAVLLALFGVAMAISFGPKEPLDYSVFSACAAALLLAHESERNLRRNGKPLDGSTRVT
jgi:putative oxidoreductase